jgi:hypothetical protein
MNCLFNIFIPRKQYFKSAPLPFLGFTNAHSLTRREGDDGGSIGGVDLNLRGVFPLTLPSPPFPREKEKVRGVE